MIVGVPKEIKNHERRVALTPAGALELLDRGHTVFIETKAGVGSGFTDTDYESVGAAVLQSPKDVWDRSELILKVKEPLPEEYELIHRDLTLFTYLHLAASQELTEALVKSRATCIAYETIEGPSGDLPLLTPMSQVAGRLSIQEGAKHLLSPMGGRGVLLGGVPGVLPGKVTILGGGVVGTEAAKMAAGLGADVTILDINPNRLAALDEFLPANVRTLYSNQFNIREQLKTTDLLVGAVLIPGGKAPKLVTKDMLSLMPKGSVIVDVAVDQGGCIETIHPTTHADPVYELEGVLHYGVANMPGSVPMTSTQALTNATLPYVLKLAEQGWESYAERDPLFAKGVNVADGELLLSEVKALFA